MEQAEQQVAVVVAKRCRHRKEIGGAVPGLDPAQNVVPVLEDRQRDHPVMPVAQQQGETVAELATEEDAVAEGAA